MEKAFRERYLKVVVATTTLAAGVNLPARLVIIHDYRRYEPGHGYVPITVMEYKQMAGRAGRPHYDPYGEAVLLARTPTEKDLLLDYYVRSRPEKLESKLATETAMRTHVLSLITFFQQASEEDIIEALRDTLYYRQFCRGQDQGLRTLVSSVLHYLEVQGLAEKRGTQYQATRLGRRVVELYIDPETAITILRGLRRRSSATDLAYLHLICATPDVPKLYVKRGEYEKYSHLAEKYRGDLLLEPPDPETEPAEYEFFLSELKTAYLLYRWISEVDEDTILTEFDIGPGDLRAYIELGEWLLYSAAELAQLLNLRTHEEALRKLRYRVMYGVREELIELVHNLEGVGRVRARNLYRYGFRTLKDIAEAPVEALTKVPGIGPTLARKIKEQAQQVLRGEVRSREERPVKVVRRERTQLTLLDFLR